MAPLQGISAFSIAESGGKSYQKIHRGGKDVSEAAAILVNTRKAASETLIKLLKSAIANAQNNFEMDVDKLYVSQVFVGPGPTMKRMMPRARGSADRILKRTSNITLALSEKE